MNENPYLFQKHLWLSSFPATTQFNTRLLSPSEVSECCSINCEDCGKVSDILRENSEIIPEISNVFWKISENLENISHILALFLEVVCKAPFLFFLHLYSLSLCRCTTTSYFCTQISPQFSVFQLSSRAYVYAHTAISHFLLSQSSQ